MQAFPAYPESTEHLVDKKLDFIFWEMTSHLRQVSKHVRHHQVAKKKRATEQENQWNDTFITVYPKPHC